ncbi:RagB/SusD family nutrient uptake outer membrane protein [Bacteroides clarus]
MKIALPVTGAQDKHHYLPIPQKVLDENPEIIQNPGY